MSTCRIDSWLFSQRLSRVKCWRESAWFKFKIALVGVPMLACLRGSRLEPSTVRKVVFGSLVPFPWLWPLSQPRHSSHASVTPRIRQQIVTHNCLISAGVPIAGIDALTELYCAAIVSTGTPSSCSSPHRLHS